MTTLLELWQSWCDVDEHTDIELWEEGGKVPLIKGNFSAVVFMDKYADRKVKVFASIGPDQKVSVTHGAFDKALVIVEA